MYALTALFQHSTSGCSQCNEGRKGKKGIQIVKEDKLFLLADDMTAYI